MKSNYIFYRIDFPISWRTVVFFACELWEEEGCIKSKKNLDKRIRQGLEDYGIQWQYDQFSLEKRPIEFAKVVTICLKYYTDLFNIDSSELQYFE